MHAGTRQIGYARVSTDEQGTDPQRDELAATGCAVILEEHAPGADSAPPVLNRLLHDIRRGETPVVVRLDRLARLVAPPAAIGQREARGTAQMCQSMIRSAPARGFALERLEKAMDGTRRDRKAATWLIKDRAARQRHRHQSGLNSSESQ